MRIVHNLAIPAKAGTQSAPKAPATPWGPAFAGMTNEGCVS